MISRNRILKSAAGTARVRIRPPIEHLQRSWDQGHFFEQELLEYIHQHFRGGIFIDIGSAIGNHTLFFAKFCNPDLVISIEPVRSQVSQQREILRLNRLQSKVKVLTLALSDSQGWGRMEHFGTNLGMFQLIEEEGASTPEKVTYRRRLKELAYRFGLGNRVPIRTLDSVIRQSSLSGKITLIKIDVERHEVPVLKGAGQVLARESPVLFIELLGGSAHHPVISFLREFGYDYVEAERFAVINMFEFRKE